MKKILGFTVKEIDAATCYLTVEGMRKLRPCRLAMRWMREHGEQEVTKNLFVEWDDERPDLWLSTEDCIELGPVGGWGWEKDLAFKTPLVLCRHLKAYIMKHGRKGK